MVQTWKCISNMSRNSAQIILGRKWAFRNFFLKNKKIVGHFIKLENFGPHLEFNPILKRPTLLFLGVISKGFHVDFHSHVSPI